jgi:hypothetical protein
MYIDVRVYDFELTHSVIQQLVQIRPSRPEYRKKARKLATLGVPILAAITLLSRMLPPGPSDESLLLPMTRDFSASFKSLSNVIRTGTSLDTIEYVLRSPEEKEQIRTIMGLMLGLDD